jgi:hypothetical protein
MTYGGLGPDLSNPELVRIKVRNCRVSDFSNQLREINKHSSLSKHVASDRDLQATVEPSARQKALAFAASIPRPSPRVTSREVTLPPRVRGAGDLGQNIVSMIQEFSAMDAQINLIRAKYTV